MPSAIRYPGWQPMSSSSQPALIRQRPSVPVWTGQPAADQRAAWPGVTGGSRKAEPACRASGPSESRSSPRWWRLARTAAVVSVSGGRAPSGTPSSPARRRRVMGAAVSVRVRWRVVDRMVQRPGSCLKRLWRWPSWHSWAVRVRMRPACQSQARRWCRVSEIWCPYAPVLWTGAAPVVPGMPARHSIPARRSAAAQAVRSVSGWPAATVTETVVSSTRLAVMPRVLMTATVPGCPVSEAMTLLPWPRVRGASWPWRLMVWTRSGQSLGSEMVRVSPVGPPRRRVVREARVRRGTGGS